MSTVRCAILFACLWLTAAPRAQNPPGYDGTFPSEAAQQALRDAMKTPWEDTKKVAGGGTWRLVDGGVTPHALGPCRGDVMEMRTAETKGPHLRLVRDHLAISLPATTDGDVAATLRWLGRPVPAGLAGEPTAAWRTAVARVDGLGPEVDGFRLSLIVDPVRAGSIDVVAWRTGAGPAELTGHLVLRVADAELPLRLQPWACIRRPETRSAFPLFPGSTHLYHVELASLLAKHRLDPSVATTQPLQLVMRIDVAEGPPRELTSARIPALRAIDAKGGSPPPQPKTGG